MTFRYPEESVMRKLQGAAIKHCQSTQAGDTVAAMMQQLIDDAEGLATFIILHTCEQDISGHRMTLNGMKVGKFEEVVLAVDNKPVFGWDFIPVSVDENRA